MRVVVRRLVGFVGFLAMCVATTWGANAVAVKNAGFEDRGTDATALNWHAAPNVSGGYFGLDSQVRRSGLSSARIDNVEAASLTMVSDPVTLEVGKLYRLRGWIKTEKAQADPMSRYPTAVAATMTMSSFPFTNYSPVVAATRDWTETTVVFFATQKEDRVRIHLGFNGKASGRAWFDDISIEPVDDIAEYIPIETVRWFGLAFRYTDKGWTFVHIEGEPYPRGYQYGYLLGKEIAAYLEKVAVRQNTENPKTGWAELRTLTDALMLRRFDPEYLEEMKGIADGAAAGGAAFSGKPVDFLDVVTLNCVVDLGQLGEGLPRTANPLTGRSFNKEEEEAQALERLHKCSSFLANGPATRDGRIVFTQLFMWGGYTGVHWDVICDVVPAKGHRLVYETFPGGIHSGADFYINSAGIMIGETTVMQTPFNSQGSPQSSRIRKAAQYASSVDEVVSILTAGNNGLYTNDWLIGDVRANEIAILLLGTERSRLWRSRSGEFPGGTEGFYWSVNNAKDPAVRKEYIANPGNAPYDVVYSASNRDVAFNEYYRREKGRIDASSAVNVLATSPINRPHACDGKVTTSEMAEKMMFLAHYGKVTLREKFPEKNSRLMPDLPNALPHLTLGYSVINPVFVTEELKKRRVAPASVVSRPEPDYSEVGQVFTFDKKLLWANTVFPATDADNWFTSGSAAYWRMLSGLPGEPKAAVPAVSDQLAEMNCRLLYTAAHEPIVAPAVVNRVYDRYGSYVVPRIRGTYLLHQLRLLLGNEKFSALMNDVHREFQEKPMTTAQFLSKAEAAAGRDLKNIVGQWIDRADLPDPVLKSSVTSKGESWTVTLDVSQPGRPFDFLTTVAVETGQEVLWHLIHVESATARFSWDVKAVPKAVVFNVGNDIPVAREAYNTFSNLFDDFRNVILCYGTARQIEAAHTLALRYQTLVADTFVENMLPVRQDVEVADEELQNKDLIVLSVGTDNALVREVAGKSGLEVGKNWFKWREKTYADAGDGLALAYPNPFNPKRVVYLLLANSAGQLYQMTKTYQSIPSWALFKGDQVIEKGYHPAKAPQLETALSTNFTSPGKAAGRRSEGATDSKSPVRLSPAKETDKTGLASPTGNALN